MRPEGFLPRIVLEHDREKPWQEWITGTVLFADVSGFTPMSEALSVLGAEGAEILTGILNRYFAAMIGIVGAHGGQVMKFGGDALQCFFPETGDWHMRSEAEASLSSLSRKTGTGTCGAKRRRACPRFPGAEGGREDAGDVAAPCRVRPESPMENRGNTAQAEACGYNLHGGHPELDSGSSLISALQAALLMQKEMHRFQNIKTPVKKFTLKMKIGLAHGECLLAGVGDPALRCDYLFAGAPVDDACRAEHHAVPGEIILSCSRTLQGAQDCKMQSANCRMEGIGEGFYRVLDVPAEHETRNSKLETASFTPAASCHLPAAVSSYLIPEVHEMVSAGYAGHVGALLEVVPVFLRFEGFRYTRKAFDLEAFHRFFTGLTEAAHRHGGRLNHVSVGDKGSHFLVLFGAPNALEKKEELAAQWAQDALRLIAEKHPGVSLRIGMHAGRCYAGIVGGAGRSGYTIMGDAVNTAARIMQGTAQGRVSASEAVAGKIGASFECTALGRRRVKGKAEALAVFGLSGRRRTTGVLRARGELAGRTSELRQVLDRIGQARTGHPGMLVLEGEPGVGKSHLAGHILSSLDKKFWEVWTTKGEISQQSHPYAPWLDLLCARVFGETAPDWRTLKAACGGQGADFLSQCAALLGIVVPKGARGGKGDQESRKRLFQRQFAEWLLENAAQKPLLLFLDDLHWFDTLSLELLTMLMNRLKGQPLFILAASRPGWNKKEFENRPAYQGLFLATLDPEGIRQIAQTILQGRVHESLMKHLLSSTRGNPFFVDQHLNYLKAEGALEQRLGEWRMRRGVEAGTAASGGDIVLARLNTLSPSQRVHLQMAACIGPVFYREVLEKALKPDFSTPEFDFLVREGLFAPLPKADAQRNTHAFSHALLQEMAYQAIPSAKRKRNHQRIGLALEALFGKRNTPLFPNLSDHFSRAGDRPRTITYAWAAGKALYDGISFPESVIHLERAHAALKRNQKDRRFFPAGLTLADAYIRTGRYDDCIALTKRIQRHASRLRRGNPFYQAILSRFDAMQRSGIYGYARLGYSMLRTNNLLPREAEIAIKYFLGVAHYRNLQFETSILCFKDVATKGDNISLLRYKISALAFLSSILFSMYKHKKAYDYIKKGLTIARRYGQIYQEIRLNIFYAGMLMDDGHLGVAESLFRKMLPEADKLGDYYIVASIYLNLGLLETRQYKYEDSEKHLEESLRIFYSIGAKSGCAKTIMNIGILFYHKQDYAKAFAKYFEATRIFEQIKEMNEFSRGYYNLAEASIKLGKKDDALAWYRKGILTFRPIDDSQLHAMFKRLYGNLLAK